MPPRTAVRATPYLRPMAEPQHRKVERKKNPQLQFSDVIETFHVKDVYQGEKSVANLKSTTHRSKAQSYEELLTSGDTATSYTLTRPPSSLANIVETRRTVAEREEWNNVLERSSKAARIRAVQMHLHVHPNPKYSSPTTTAPQPTQPAKQINANLAACSTVEFGWNWCYATRAHCTCIGKKHLTLEERKRLFQVEAKGSATAAGTTWATSAVYCYVPYLGHRRCYVPDGCPPALSEREEIDDHGAVFIWTKGGGPAATLADGTVVYMSTSHSVPMIDGYVEAEICQDAGMPELDDCALPMQCQPCEQPPGLPPPGSIVGAAPLPTMATDRNGCGECVSWSDRIRALKQNKLSPSTASLAAKQLRQWCRERKEHNNPILVPAEEEPSIGTRHGSSVRTSSAKQGEIRSALEACSLPSGPFFVEVSSGSGRMAAAVRQTGVTANEYDLTEKGSRKNLLHKSVLQELTEPIEHPNCIGVWFGFPCGTFSSALRNDGGPPPLRGINSKDIWGLPHLVRRERDRVRSANKSLLGMHVLMRMCERKGVPFYLENVQRSKYWMHPLIRKWVRHSARQLVQFDYCQYATSWGKSITILAYNNSAANPSVGQKSRETCRGKSSICSRTGVHHGPLARFMGGKAKDQYKTNADCPYPFLFCEDVAPILAKPKRSHNPLDVSETMVSVAGPTVSMQRPPDDHYLCHLPKYPGCKACNDCKVQRKHCRDKGKATKKKQETIIKLHNSEKPIPVSKAAPKTFGELVTSDSVVVLRKNLKSAAMHGDTTALVVRDRGTGWTRAYPAKSKPAEGAQVVVQDFKGPAKVDPWYSDGAPELHAACRDEGIRHDTGDPHRSETNGVSERTNRTVIEGARTLLVQSALPYKYWRSAMKCFCSLYNFEHVDKKTGTAAYKQRHGETSQGKFTPMARGFVTSLPQSESCRNARSSTQRCEMTWPKRRDGRNCTTSCRKEFGRRDPDKKHP